MIDPTILFQILIAGSMAYGLWTGTKKPDRRLQIWKDAARSCGLQILATSPGSKPQLLARSGLIQVRIDGKDRMSWIVLEIPAAPEFQHVTVQPAAVFQHDQKTGTGDPVFDRVFSVAGPMRLLLALLDAETRHWLIATSHGSSFRISRGEMLSIVAHDDVPKVLPRLLDLCRRLAPSSEIARHLAGNVAHDPQRGVRLQSLLALIGEPRDRPEIAKALRKACLDQAPEIRLHAAKEIGAEGHGVLLEIAESAANDELCAEAVSALSRQGALPFERANAILDLALRRRRLRTARAGLEALVPARDAAIAKLAKVLERERGDLAIAAAGALGAIATPAAELPLIEALKREDPDLRKTVIEALGHMGTAAAVLPLQEAGDADRDLRRIARQAIDEIQSRLQGATPGQLSLAGGEAGQLSLAQEGGELSLAPDPAETPAGRLSLGDEEKPGA